MFCHCISCQPERAFLQGLQLFSDIAVAFAKNEHSATLLQHTHRILMAVVIEGKLVASFTFPVHRHDAQKAKEASGKGMAENIATCEKMKLTIEVAGKQKRIHERRGVVGEQQQRPGCNRIAKAEWMNLPVEEP